ncbi:unknown [Clostridium sp. CAG:245]|jgi:K+-transporting ATPase c subunit|nr:hypothetical protein [Clostridia bacterium]CDA58896.1 unknown [Clostridium sp. CAG:245]
MVNNATDLELKEHNDNAQFASELNSKQEPVNQNSANASTLDCSSTPEISASQITDTSIFETNSEIQNNSSVENSLEAENNNVNCLALTVKKDYSLSIVKHVFFRTWKTTWRVALSVFILNFLSFFF